MRDNRQINLRDIRPIAAKDDYLSFNELESLATKPSTRLEGGTEKHSGRLSHH